MLPPLLQGFHGGFRQLMLGVAPGVGLIQGILGWEQLVMEAGAANCVLDSGPLQQQPGDVVTAAWGEGLGRRVSMRCQHNTRALLRCLVLTVWL